tara:strand:- start:4069 stop:4719 length:651 start_codon:yes stop_codon:yes gene_type:complete
MKKTNPSYFNLEQCIHSPIAIKNKINNFPGSDYVIDEKRNLYNPHLYKNDIIYNLHNLFKYCINPIFRNFGANLALTSVYRNKEVNKLLGGVPNSQHIYGYAADIVLTNNIPTSTLFNWCVNNLSQYHQLIWEYPEKGNFSPFYQNEEGEGELEVSNLPPNFSWVHISYIVGDNEKINSVSSTNPKIHKAYKDENTFYLGDFTHKIALANQQLLIP